MIVTLTMNPTIDLSATVANVAANKKLRCQNIRYEPGGGGVNVSRAIKKLGGNTFCIYMAGGGLGGMLGAFLGEEEVPHEPMIIEGQTRQAWIVDELSTGHQFRFGMPGPVIHEAEWSKVIEYVGAMSPAPDYFVASGSLPPGVPADFYGRLAARLKERKTHVTVDTSGEPLRLAADAGVDLLKPNLRELETLVGRELPDEQSQEDGARELIRGNKTKAVVLSLGAGGVLLVTDHRNERFRSPTVAIKSRVGAGDSTVGGIVLSLQRGLDLREAVRFGVATGAAAVMTPGTELCRREDAERLYKKMVERG